MNEKNLSVLSEFGKKHFESGWHKLSRHHQFISHIVANKQVAVTGATGWLGRNLLPQLGRASVIQLFSRRPRTVNILGVPYTTKELPLNALDIEADFLFDFAFHRRDVPSELGPFESRSENERLLELSKEFMSSENVGKYIGVSSGAARVEGKGTYGAQKRNLEKIFLHSSKAGDRLLRIWAMTGLYASGREQFAAVDFVNGALFNGKIEITSKTPVFRSYSHVSELLALALDTSVDKKIIESGGTPIEMRDLAKTVSALVSHQVRIDVLYPSREKAPEKDYYVPPSNRVKDFLEAIGLSPMTIEEQLALMIVNVYSSSLGGSR